jgi:hypothetical protein
LALSILSFLKYEQSLTLTFPSASLNKTRTQLSVHKLSQTLNGLALRNSTKIITNIFPTAVAAAIIAITHSFYSSSSIALLASFTA